MSAEGGSVACCDWFLRVFCGWGGWFLFHGLFWGTIVFLLLCGCYLTFYWVLVIVGSEWFSLVFSVLSKYRVRKAIMKIVVWIRTSIVPSFWL